ncbi:MAG: hypothetical protein KJO40_00450 [Deltaproteobacteria bacterium]|nr:hypothetical protein [Deltaproteobacteria bacterium]NND27648.1 hypothetical protein [Myxococcales bacterium]MBT8465892.1 hypothetical protein [Deltaproteobacteria bacterium]MBT8481587.1 hypothetical protein [Deltaproteobacteria bacterium]NNK06593.1 hypothetical protein [Myxococcales bacterium]
MKKCISASSALLATAMMVTLSFGCGEGIEGETGSQSAELNAGQCNAIIATDLQSAQRCAQGQCGVAECTNVGGAFLDFFFNNPECGLSFGAGELNGLPGNASVHPQTGESKHIQDVVCSSIVQCGLCPQASAVVCGVACEEAGE